MRIQEILEYRLKVAMKENIFERDLIRVVLAELSRSEQAKVNKNLSDEDVMKIMSLMMKDMKITNTEESLKEIKFIEQFFPEQMNEDKIKSILSSIIVDLNLEKTPKNIGILKKEFDKKHPNQDGKLVGSLSKQLLTNDL